MVWSTTASISVERVSRSIWSRRRVENASIVLVVLYLRRLKRRSTAAWMRRLGQLSRVLAGAPVDGFGAAHRLHLRARQEVHAVTLLDGDRRHEAREDGRGVLQRRLWERPRIGDEREDPCVRLVVRHGDGALIDRDTRVLRLASSESHPARVSQFGHRPATTRTLQVDAGINQPETVQPIASSTYARKMGQDREFEDVSPEATAESDAGLMAFERGDLAAAERHLRRADQLGGHWGAFRLGFLLEESGRTAEAEKAYRRAVDRGSRSAAVNLGHMLEQRNDRAGAASPPS
jgi:hypothetical protein